MKKANGKEKLFTMLMCIALVLPLAPVGAQDADNFWSDAASSDKNNAGNTEAAAPSTADETESPRAAAETTAPKTAPKTSEQKPSPKAPKVQGAGSATGIINKVIGYISQIGAIFGKSTGVRIGGTSGSAIVMLIIAKLVQDRAPSWLKWLLYLSGGTMVAGSGANITQSLMRLF